MRRPVPAGAAGFTLIEILIVLFIFGVLVTLAVNVARYVYDEAARKKTQSTQAIVISAIQAFYEEFEHYPADRDPPVSEYFPVPSGVILQNYLRGALDDLDYSNEAFKYLMERDPGLGDVALLNNRIRNVTSEKLLGLSRDAFDGTTIRDGFGIPMQ